MRISGWSSDVCSSDLGDQRVEEGRVGDVGRDPGIELVGDGPPPGRLAVVAREARGAVLLGVDEVMPDVAGDDPAVAEAELVLEVEAGLRLGRSEEHTSELQSLMRISYAVFCLKKNKQKQLKYE